jgi:glycosyltransferase involved in cell wall biosynthesis
MLSICAVIAARNEEPYLRVLLPILAKQSIDVVILDNESTDGSAALYSRHKGSPIILLEKLAYHGSFSLTEQLEAKETTYQALPHDWVIHLDADEILEHREPGLTLRDAIEEAHAGGYNVVNFEEFVFLPEPDANYEGRDFFALMRRYYFFEPEKSRRHLAWRRDMSFDTTTLAGHRLLGRGLSLSPATHILRHYIVLSYAHALRKYLNRRFSRQDLARGWHIGPAGSRTDFTEQNLALPSSSPYLHELESGRSKAFRRDLPANRHYWMWDTTA